MKKFCLIVLALGALASCQDKDPGPSLNGTFTGPASIRNAQNGYGLSSYSDVDVTLKQISATSVEVHSRNFETFVVSGLQQTGPSSYSAGDGDNLFRYSGDASSRSLLIDWTTNVSGTDHQTIRFGGGKKK